MKENWSQTEMYLLVQTIIMSLEIGASCTVICIPVGDTKKDYLYEDEKNLRANTDPW